MKLADMSPAMTAEVNVHTQQASKYIGEAFERLSLHMARMGVRSPAIVIAQIVAGQLGAQVRGWSGGDPSTERHIKRTLLQCFRLAILQTGTPAEVDAYHREVQRLGFAVINPRSSADAGQN